MKKFLAILAGSYLGSVLYISVAWNFYPQETGSPWPYSAVIALSFFLSLIFSLLSIYSLRIFSIRDRSLLTLGTTFFIAQALVEPVASILPDYGILTLTSAMIICSLGAAFCLRLIKNGR